MIEMSDELLLRLSVQRATLGHVSANVAAISQRLDQRQILIGVVYFDRPTDEDVREFDSVITEIIADFPQGYKIEMESRLLQDVKELSSGHLVFLRREAINSATLLLNIV